MRVVNRLVSLLFWLALAVVAALTAIEVLFGLLDRPGLVVQRPELAAWIERSSWSDTTPVLVGVLLLVVGLLLVLGQLAPRRPDAWPGRSGREDRSLAYERPGLQNHVRAVAEREREVEAARVRLTKRRLKVRLDVIDSAQPERVKEAARDRIADALRALRVEDPPSVRVQARTADRRAR